MLALERQQYIKSLIIKNKVVLVSELSRDMKVSEETVRKDLEKMEAQDLLTRVHGGAFLQEGYGKETSVKVREKLYTKEKEAMSELCMGYINKGDTLFLDCSTTVLELAKLLAKTDLKCTVITNSRNVADTLYENDQIRIILSGGEYYSETQSFYEENVVQSLKQYHIDKAFLSPLGVNWKAGLTSGIAKEAMFLKTALEESDEHFVLADHTKINKTGLYVIAGLDSIDHLILDSPLQSEHKKLQDTLLSYEKEIVVQNMYEVEEND